MIPSAFSFSTYVLLIVFWVVMIFCVCTFSCGVGGQRRYVDAPERYHEYDEADYLVFATCEEFYPGGGVGSRGTGTKWMVCASANDLNAYVALLAYFIHQAPSFDRGLAPSSAGGELAIPL